MSGAWQGPALMTLAVVLVVAAALLIGGAARATAREKGKPLSDSGKIVLGEAMLTSALLLVFALVATFWAGCLWGAP